ncbi:MAG: DEAD/DEAH box helicase family protein, partial [Armatimonadetes bacterium]|nr:DEAD/DEAH box helicase family protein [Armatimonadota bacterium]
MAATKRTKPTEDLPVQPVEQPILCSPYKEPTQHWVYDTESGEASLQPERRAAGYWYKTEITGSEQRRLFAEEQRDDLPLVNALRDDVRRWREAGYRGAEAVTRELLNHWSRADLPRRLFFCQREAVETIIYLAEMRMSGRSSRTGFQRFALTDDDLRRLLAREKPALPGGSQEFFPTLIDRPAMEALLPLTRLGCKMATGSGKTVVMAMLIAWAFCNRGRNRNSTQFPDAVLICCPNLTVKERLQVLRPDMAGNYYEEFDLVPVKYRPLMQHGKVLITNWHVMNTESEHKEGDASYKVVNKGPETAEDFARRVLAELHDRMPVMVLNDEGHHCWRPAPQVVAEDLDRDEKWAVDEELQEATVWVEGLDRINNALRPSVSGGARSGD